MNHDDAPVSFLADHVLIVGAGLATVEEFVKVGLFQFFAVLLGGSVHLFTKVIGEGIVACIFLEDQRFGNEIFVELRNGVLSFFFFPGDAFPAALRSPPPDLFLAAGAMF